MSFRLNPTRSVFETLYPSLSERVRYSKNPESGSGPSENGGVNTGSVVHMACWARHGPIQDLDTYYGDTHQQASPQDPVLHY